MPGAMVSSRSYIVRRGGELMGVRPHRPRPPGVQNLSDTLSAPVGPRPDHETSGTTLKGYFGERYLPAFRFGSFTFSRGGALYRILLRRCEMMFNRARRLSSEYATYQGAQAVSVAANMASRARV